MCGWKYKCSRELYMFWVWNSNNFTICISSCVPLLQNLPINPCCSSENYLTLCAFYWNWFIFHILYSISDRNVPPSSLHFDWVYTFSITLVKLESFLAFITRLRSINSNSFTPASSCYSLFYKTSPWKKCYSSENWLILRQIYWSWCIFDKLYRISAWILSSWSSFLS